MRRELVVTMLAALLISADIAAASDGADAQRRDWRMRVGGARSADEADEVLATIDQLVEIASRQGALREYDDGMTTLEAAMRLHHEYGVSDAYGTYLEIDRYLMTLADEGQQDTVVGFLRRKDLPHGLPGVIRVVSALLDPKGEGNTLCSGRDPRRESKCLLRQWRQRRHTRQMDRPAPQPAPREGGPASVQLTPTSRAVSEPEVERPARASVNDTPSGTALEGSGDLPADCDHDVSEARSQRDYEDKLAVEARRLDAVLSAEHEKLRSVLSPDGLQALLSVEAAWKRYREEEIILGSFKSEGGTQSSADSIRTDINVTCLRIKWLREHAHEF